MSACDVVITGGGAGGLLTGALLAKRGLSVVVVEQNARPGGYATSVDVGGYAFDVGAQDLTFVGSQGVDLAIELGLRDRFRHIPAHMTTCFPGRTVVWNGDETIEEFRRLFPSEAAGVTGLFRLMDSMYKEMDRFLATGSAGFDPSTFPLLTAAGGKTALDMMSDHLVSRELMSMISAFGLFYQGAPPTRLAASHFAGLVMSYLRNGAYLYRGGAASLSRDLAAIIVESGGRVRLNAKVESLSSHGCRVTGVTLVGGERIEGRAVVAAMDLREMAAMIPDGLRVKPAFRVKLNAFSMSDSRCQLLSAHRGVAERTPPVLILKETYDWDREYDAFIANRPLSLRCFCTPFEGIEKSAFGLSVATIASLEVWRSIEKKGPAVVAQAKREHAEHLRRMLAGRYPEWDDAPCVEEELLTPPWLHRLCGASNAALYGWDTVPGQTGVKRFDVKGPVEGLYLAGQWASPGGSVCLVFRGADLTARVIGSDLS